MPRDELDEQMGSSDAGFARFSWSARTGACEQTPVSTGAICEKDWTARSRFHSWISGPRARETGLALPPNHWKKVENSRVQHLKIPCLCYRWSLSCVPINASLSLPQEVDNSPTKAHKHQHAPPKYPFIRLRPPFYHPDRIPTHPQRIRHAIQPFLRPLQDLPLSP